MKKTSRAAPAKSVGELMGALEQPQSSPPPYLVEPEKIRPGTRMGFFTDTSICIGCKACEVACKEWNSVPTQGYEWKGTSYDNTGALGANAWRHVAFIEQKPIPLDGDRARAQGAQEAVRWLMSSDVCKHCTHAACLEVCPTGALFRTEFGTVVVQEDICNGCGYCVPACPFGVIDRRDQPEKDGRAFKCTMCYDRLKGGIEPACAQACPTKSIQFGPLEEIREHAGRRVEALHSQGQPEANLYLADDDNGVGGAGAFFLLLDRPETYRLPSKPRTPTRELGETWAAVAAAAGALALGLVAAFVGARR